MRTEETDIDYVRPIPLASNNCRTLHLNEALHLARDHAQSESGSKLPCSALVYLLAGLQSRKKQAAKGEIVSYPEPMTSCQLVNSIQLVELHLPGEQGTVT